MSICVISCSVCYRHVLSGKQEQQCSFLYTVSISKFRKGGFQALLLHPPPPTGSAQDCGVIYHNTIATLIYFARRRIPAEIRMEIPVRIVLGYLCRFYWEASLLHWIPFTLKNTHFLCIIYQSYYLNKGKKISQRPICLNIDVHFTL